MIDCLLVRISRDRQGQAAREEHQIAGEELSIGRGDACSIPLPDPRANLHFATIKCGVDGALLIDGEGTLIHIDGAYEHSAPLNEGSRIALGPYEFLVEKLGGKHDLTISVELVHPLPIESVIRNIPPRSLTETGLSKRKLSYWMAGIILAVFLGLPLLTALSPVVRSAVTHSPLSPSRLWNPGAVSPGHSAFGSQCIKCHEAPFLPVRNEACLSCHKETGQHLADSTVDKHVFKESRCTECHWDHQNSRPIAMQGSGECVLCHGDVKARHADTNIPDIHDFSNHPDFRLAFKAGINAADVKRVVQTDTRHLVENSGLEFPHDMHVGLVEVPWDRGTIKDMKCTDCHQAEDGGMHFKPIDMKQHCYSCHQEQLDFNLAPEGRKLPHGSVTLLSSTLRDFYAGLAFKENKSKAWVDEQMAKAVHALSDGEGCDFCHTVQPDESGDNLLKIAPLRITQDWFPAARFPHDRHATFNCVECHKIEQSSQSADVAIPDIQSCRQCHTGSHPVRGKVTSSCIACHDFHAAKTKSP
jgi:hypothetical protein